MNWIMNYEKLVEKRKIEIPEGYTENHHILPKCLGGLKTPENMVRLTAREHFIAHLLLVKKNPDHAGLVYAAFRMSGNDKFSSRKYAWLREKNSVMQSERMSTRIISEKTRGKMKIAAKTRCENPEIIKKIEAASKGRGSNTLWYNDGEKSFRLDPLKAPSSLKLGRLPHKRTYKIITCPHCGHSGKSVGNIKRWHFDNCKKRAI